MGTTGTVGEGYAAARGVAALVVMLGAARLPDRLAGTGAALAARIAPAEGVEEHADEHAVHLPVQRSRSTPVAGPITV